MHQQVAYQNQVIIRSTSRSVHWDRDSLWLISSIREVNFKLSMKWHKWLNQWSRHREGIPTAKSRERIPKAKNQHMEISGIWMGGLNRLDYLSFILHLPRRALCSAWSTNHIPDFLPAILRSNPLVRLNVVLASDHQRLTISLPCKVILEIAIVNINANLTISSHQTGNQFKWNLYVTKY